jgi:hypothetical protein
MSGFYILVGSRVQGFKGSKVKVQGVQTFKRSTLGLNERLEPLNRREGRTLELFELLEPLNRRGCRIRFGGSID